MTVTEFKKLIGKNQIPTKMVWVDHCHSLVEHYLDQLTLILNKKIKKVFSQEEAVSITTFDFDSDNTLYLFYLPKKEIVEVLNQIGEVHAIGMVEDPTESKYNPYPEIVFENLSRNATIVFLEKQVEIPQKKKDQDKKEVEHYLSRELIEELVDYFENNLDLCMNEINKVKVLELTTSWDHAFKGLMSCLPKKDVRLRSLSWFSGGDVDTCQVLYNLYIKKLRNLPEATKEEQRTWAKLVTEAVWTEACIVSGFIGDYAMDYLRLVESSLPGDFKVQYFPPVFFHELKDFPEYSKSGD